MPDFLGFGYSDRPDDFGYTIDDHADSIAYLLDQLQVTGCMVIGASMGGAVAITLATRRPDLVARLVLAEGVLDGLDVFGAASQSEEQWIASGHSIFLEQFHQMILSSPHPSDLPFWLMEKLVPPHAFYRTAVSMAKGAQPSWREQLYELKIPRLYIWGDENFRSEYTETFTAHGVQIAVIPHAGHPMMNHNPAAFVRAISEFTAH
jgi:pimeloyl-ACP methyl ester carboxylesterase